MRYGLRGCAFAQGDLTVLAELDAQPGPLYYWTSKILVILLSELNTITILASVITPWACNWMKTRPSVLTAYEPGNNELNVLMLFPGLMTWLFTTRPNSVVEKSK